MQQWLQQHPFEGLKDIITAYSSLTILYDTAFIKNYYDPPAPVFEWVRQRLITAYQQSGNLAESNPVRHRIPVYYGGEHGMDLDAMAREKQLTTREIIRIHTEKVYRVYMIGFLPGFPYLAAVDERIAMPRKAKPVPVPAGSVGIAGSQTGIYPFNGPGGWNIIGRTPQTLFNPQAENPVPLKAGDEVVFYEA